ncbi:N-acetylmuramoyl-L-alanine amidase [Tumebacillus sp. ITR2]|uniref:N-acetylmuramoyl-L-alanine amidase n=1 Tax=Tumebacillus amylolyticus TaxID=2801339 RepID=A0ABS1JAD7_9BACL|nr:N-acetylmuramoyl-L-alanine amidase [Tumebacillus amylolyticus]MBL0387004.1 N-acetylmuramoyl-L-alanine amidase [Tumebacillus amylolyticus]
MKLTRSMLTALACSALLTTPVFAADHGASVAKDKTDKTDKTIAGEPLSGAEPAPANFDAAKKAKQPDTKDAGTVKPGIVNGNPVVVLDPGHGGTDPGGVGNGLYEKNLTLDIALRSRSYMWANYPIWVYMTRETDTDVSLSGRTSYANSQNADFFVSYHINSYSDASPNGLETYYYPGASDGLSLATNLYNKLKGSYSTLRGVKSADYYVLHYTNMSAALGETGFISNASDATKLNDANFRQQLAVQYAQGMHVYWWGY